MLARNPVRVLGAFHAQETTLHSYLPPPPFPLDSLRTFRHSTDTARSDEAQILRHSPTQSETLGKSRIQGRWGGRGLAVGGIHGEGALPDIDRAEAIPRYDAGCSSRNPDDEKGSGWALRAEGRCGDAELSSKRGAHAKVDSRRELPATSGPEPACANSDVLIYTQKSFPSARITGDRARASEREREREREGGCGEGRRRDEEEIEKGTEATQKAAAAKPKGIFFSLPPPHGT